MKKQNCWEFMKCGKELGGRNTGDHGVCPAAMEARLNGTHGGVFGGRACWVVSNTLCDGVRHGTFAEKLRTCAKCGFYLHVTKDEGFNLVLAPVLLNKLGRIPGILRRPEEDRAA